MIPVAAAAAPAFRQYDHSSTFYDEMFDGDGSPRRHCADFFETIRETPPDDLRQIQERVTRSFLHEGITFTVYGDEQTIERVFPIDCLPRIVRGDEWDEVARGLEQRLRALNLFLHDIYHQGHIVRDGVIPAELVYGNKHYRIEMRGVEVPHGAYVSVCGTDLVRTHDGFAVLEDNLRVPSGVSYMLACRDAIKRSMPRLFRRSRVRDVSTTPAAARDAPVAGAAAGERSEHRPAHPGRLHWLVLRARLPGPPDGHRTRRGTRPARPNRRCTCARPPDSGRWT